MSLEQAGFETLVDQATLAARLDDPDWLILDCRFSLFDSQAGRRAYEEGHIPGARHVDLERDLSGTRVPGQSGRHPLPPREVWLARLGDWGLHPRKQVVVYDDAGGAVAARCWWMLRWAGHARAAVLDGGWPLWRQAGRPIATGTATPSQIPPFDYGQLPSLTRQVEAAAIDGGRQVLLDAREAARFRGEAEPIDPVAGHIPGARNLPFGENLHEGRFKSPGELRGRFLAAGAGQDAEVVSYCGSGVTAAHNILAMRIAGLPEASLYPGSWSEWITDPRRPIGRGA